MAKSTDPFRHFLDSSPEAIRLVVMMYVRYPLSLRNVEDLGRVTARDFLDALEREGRSAAPRDFEGLLRR